MDGLLCNPSVLSYFKPPRSKERGQGTGFLLGYGQSPITPPRWIASQSICSPTFFKPPRSGERVQGTMFPAGVWGLESRARCAGFSVTEIGNRRERLRDHASFPDQSPITPPQWIASQSIPLPLLQTAAKRRKGAGNNVPCWGMGQSPIVPHRPPRPPSLDAYLSPFHHRRTRSARKRIKLPVRHVLDSVVRLHRTRRRRSRRRYAVAMRCRHAPA